MRNHLVCSDTDGILTADTVMQDRDDGASCWIYMCGPPPMMRSLAKGFRRLGVPASQIRWNSSKAADRSKLTSRSPGGATPAEDRVKREEELHVH